MYQLSGKASAEFLAVSLWTLRKHYRGRITIFATDQCLSFVKHMQRDGRLAIDIAKTELVTGCKQPHWVTKCTTFLSTPYDQTIYLDADTVVRKKLDVLMPSPLAVCMAGRLGDKTKLSTSTYFYLQNLRHLGPVMRDLVDGARDRRLPIFNSGLLVFKRNHPFLWELHGWVMAARDRWVTDDHVGTLLLPRWPCRHLSDRWNYSPKYSNPHQSGNVMLHFHHKIMFTLPRARALYLPYAREAWENNAGFLKDWAGQGEPRFSELLDADRD